MNIFTAHILEADGIFYEGELESLIVPIDDGEYGVLAGHSDIFLAIVPGIIKYKPPGGEYREASVSYGFLRIQGEDVLLLIESAEHPDEVDEERVRDHERRAREALKRKQNVHEYNLAEARLKRSITRLNLKNRSTRE